MKNSFIPATSQEGNSVDSYEVTHDEPPHQALRCFILGVKLLAGRVKEGGWDEGGAVW